MNTLTTIVACTLPSLVVLAAVWIILGRMLKEEREKRTYELRRQDRTQTTPLRLRGYERLALLLERITPGHMLMNADLTGLTLTELQRQLLQTVRLETDHNLSQQIYVGDEVWQAVMLAREETVNFINAIALQMPEGATALQYAQTLITAYANNGETPVQRAMQLLKAEARSLL
ncbi:MAG: hypothetical protein IJ169_01300 [Paludibacteraceae bacterium]|nr:hypothetical protein [Paludibacteraceae bacterium]